MYKICMIDMVGFLLWIVQYPSRTRRVLYGFASSVSLCTENLNEFSLSMSAVSLIVVVSFFYGFHSQKSKAAIGKLTTSVCWPIRGAFVWQKAELEDACDCLEIPGYNGDKTVSAKGKGNKTGSAIEAETETETETQAEAEAETETVPVNLKIPLKMQACSILANR